METITLLIILGLKVWSVIFTISLVIAFIIRVIENNFFFNFNYKESFIFALYFISIYAWTL